jgi:hypothetical protein
MNHSNKDEKPVTESGEGRPLIKENMRQLNMLSTQSGGGMSQGLERVRQAAKENKELKFTALLHHLTVDLLQECFYGMKREAAPGVDGVMGVFRERLSRFWRHNLMRRSQKAGLSWERMHRLLEVWIPRPRVLHPWPEVRFAVRNQDRSRMR